MSVHNINGIDICDDVFLTKFACDYEKCHGACCWGKLKDETYGCPLTPKEASMIRKNKSKLAYLVIDEQTRKRAFTKNVYVVGNQTRVRLTPDEKCIYSDCKGCIVKQLSGNAPISCELYPLDVEENVLFICHDFDSFCQSGFIKGENENIYLIDFLKDSIIRKFGEDFFLQLKKIQHDILTNQ